LDRISRLLEAGHDIARDRVSDRLASISTLRDLMSQLEETRSNLEPVLTGGGRVEDADWGEKAALRRWGLAFLEKHAGSPPERLVKAVSFPAARADLAEAVRRNVACRTRELSESWKFLTGLFAADRVVSTGIVIGSAPVTELAAWTAQR